jgi:hypothetical protein
MLFTIGESSRYRYQIEAFIWLLVALAGRELVPSDDLKRHLPGVEPEREREARPRHRPDT